MPCSASPGMNTAVPATTVRSTPPRPEPNTSPPRKENDMTGPESLQDPTQQHDQPDAESTQLPSPGSQGSVTSEMGDEPDHGEKTYAGSGKLKDRVAVVTGG